MQIHRGFVGATWKHAPANARRRFAWGRVWGLGIYPSKHPTKKKKAETFFLLRSLSQTKTISPYLAPDPHCR